MDEKTQEDWLLANPFDRAVREEVMRERQALAMRQSPQAQIMNLRGELEEMTKLAVDLLDQLRTERLLRGSAYRVSSWSVGVGVVFGFALGCLVTWWGMR